MIPRVFIKIWRSSDGDPTSPRNPIHLGPAGDLRPDPMAVRIPLDRIAIKAPGNH
jgi:hypothetical protein